VKMQKHITCNTSNWMLCNFGKHCISQFIETCSTSTCNAIWKKQCVSHCEKCN
jgi:hypothetical protein